MLLAYIDPGTGSLVIQTVIAGFLGALLAIKMGWSKIRGFFRSLFGAAAPEAEKTEPDLASQSK